MGGSRSWRNRSHVIGSASRLNQRDSHAPTCHLATTTDEETGAGSAVTETETAIGTETVVEIGIEAEGIDIATHAEEAAPEALEEARVIGVLVRVVSFHSRSKSSLGTERDRRDYRYDDRRDSDRRERDDRRRDDRLDERDRHREDPRNRDVPKIHEVKPSPGSKEGSGECGALAPSQVLTSHVVPPIPEPRIQSGGLENGQEEGESMDAVNQDDEAMMGIMGITGFGSTKVWSSSMRAHQYLETFDRGSMSKGTKRAPQRLRKSELGGST